MSKSSSTLPVNPEAAAAARRFVREHGPALDSIRLTEADLLTTELVGNVVKHALEAEEFRLDVEDSPLGARVTITHPFTDVLGSPQHGVGFSLLERIAKAWGIDQDGDLLSIWFVLRTPGGVTSVEDIPDADLIVWLDSDPVGSSDELIRRHRDLARSIAARYRGKGVAKEDLEQVALMALLKAIQRFEPDRGELRAYAAATISGEMKKMLRDHAWSVRVARSLQENSLLAARTTEKLAQVLGRTPDPEELAEAIGIPSESVREALEAQAAFRSRSIDETVGDDGVSLIDRLGEIDDRMMTVENRMVLEEAIEQLPERQRRILALRFEDDLTQSEIGELVGISQMHVSRLLARALESLRASLN